MDGLIAPLGTLTMPRRTAPEATAEDRKASLSGMFFMHRRARTALRRMADLYAFGLRADPEEDKLLMLLVGESGSGKSRVVRKFAEEVVGAIRGPAGDGKAVRVTCPSRNASTKGIAMNILQALGDPHWERGSESRMLLRAKAFVAELGVGMLILDEVHHLVLANSSGSVGTMSRNAKDALKMISESLRIPIVLVVNGEAEGRLIAQPEIKRRQRAQFSMEPFSWSDPDDRAEHRLFLRELGRSLPFSAPSALHALPLARAIHAHCEGLIGQTVQLVEHALDIAVDAGELGIDASALLAAAAALYGGRTDLVQSFAAAGQLDSAKTARVASRPTGVPVAEPR
ncbi:TniB family NTP-binding protein [Azospirillum sp. INR13]|uniref:TniB family NTP-binding protein n=1 Tax=Azospirillum sp. INR13 TaxID=2596919 RepID=UPI0018923D71|nr:TniB family NTP-binding protein [Azospirillum sp. INR13]